MISLLHVVLRHGATAPPPGATQYRRGRPMTMEDILFENIFGGTALVALVYPSVLADNMELDCIEFVFFS